MADRLTQLQDCLDQLLDLMYASTTYIQQRHPYAEIPGQPSQAPEASAATPLTSAVPQSAVSLTNGHDASHSRPQPNGPAQAQVEVATAPSGTPPPEQEDLFNAALRELAQDLVLKEQQAEVLINSLPGLGNSEADQKKRMRDLEAELKAVGVERAKAEKERDEMVNALGEVILKVKRVPLNT